MIFTGFVSLMYSTVKSVLNSHLKKNQKNIDTILKNILVGNNSFIHTITFVMSYLMAHFY